MKLPFATCLWSFTLPLCMACLVGCAGTSPDSCTTTFQLRVSPESATVDHTATPPGNQVQFQGAAFATASAPSCPVPALARLEYAAWTNPDPDDIQISSANDSTNGTATCVSATNGPVILTGTFAPVTVTGPAGSGTDTTTQTVSLTCK